MDGHASAAATEPLVRRGLGITVIEPAPAMAAMAKEKLDDRCELVTTTFEAWVPARRFEDLLDGQARPPAPTRPITDVP